MTDWREPHWSEGMLLLPHHFQAAFRHLAARFDAAWQHSGAFPWGVGELILSDSGIRDGVIAIERCGARTREGTWIAVPQNTDVAPRPCMENLKASPDGLMVYLAVPRLHEFRPNASYDPSTSGSALRHRIDSMELRDENTGDNVQSIEVHSLTGRILLGEEVAQAGFEALPVARVYLSGEEGGVPRRDATYVPPLLRMGASADLTRMVQDVVNELGSRVRDLASDAAKREMSFRSGMEEHTERLLMIHAVNPALAVLRQWVAQPDLRPRLMYEELCRLAGALSVFHPDRAVKEYPIYDHTKIGEDFKLVCDHIRVLLRSLSAGRVAWRDFEARERGEGLQVQLEDLWLSARRELYIGVHCGTMDGTELDTLLRRLDWKVASIDEVDNLFRQGLPGLELRPVRTATGILPAGPDIKYYQVGYDGQRWPRVEASKVLAMRYSPDAQAKLSAVRFRMYIVMDKQSP